VAAEINLRRWIGVAMREARRWNRYRCDRFLHTTGGQFIGQFVVCEACAQDSNGPSPRHAV
jgi:hypothetical protein